MKAEIHWNLSEKPVPGSPVGFDPGHGAGLEFLGVVRELEDGRPLSGIDYSAYAKLADAEMRRLCEEHELEFAPSRGGRTAAVWIHHRLGFVPVGVASLSIRVHAAHSAEAFERCRWWLERIKARLPVWKRPVFTEPTRATDAG